MNALLRLLGQLIVFGALTFAFVVLYGYGPSGFIQGIEADGKALLASLPQAPSAVVNTVSTLTEKPPESPPPTPAPTNTPSPLIEELRQKHPMNINAPISIYPSSSPDSH